MLFMFIIYTTDLSKDHQKLSAGCTTTYSTCRTDQFMREEERAHRCREKHCNQPVVKIAVFFPLGFFM